MPAESVEDPEQYEPELEVVGERLVAVIDRLWEDVGEDESEGDDEPDTTTRTAIDGVVEPPEGASQSAVEAAVEAAESDKGRIREADDDHFSM